MKQKAPRPKGQTERQKLLALLLDAPLQDAKELSAGARISEKEVYGHLPHLQKSLRQNGQSLVIHAASCQRCDFTFDKRGLFSKPGRCPECRGERINPPLYQVVESS